MVNLKTANENFMNSIQEIGDVYSKLGLADDVEAATMTLEAATDRLQTTIDNLDIDFDFKNIDIVGVISGLSTKNATMTNRHSHTFIYRGWEVTSDGNPYAHAIMRGFVDRDGHSISNYHYEDLQKLSDLYAASTPDKVAPALSKAVWINESVHAVYG